jgi:hypothetical protein
MTTGLAALASPTALAGSLAGQDPLPLPTDPAVIHAAAQTADSGTRAGLHHRFAYGLVLTHQQTRDELLVPLRWAGPGAGLRVEWETAGPASRHALALQVPITVLQNRYGHTGYALCAEAAYSYQHEIAETGSEGVLSLGGHLGWKMRNAFYESWDDEHIYWFTTYSLGPRLAWSGRPGSGVHLTATLEVPVLAAVSRPPHHRLNKTDRLTSPWFHITEPQRSLELATFPRYASVRTGVTATMRPGRRSTIAFSFDFEVSTYDSPERVITLSHRLSILHRLAW